MIDEEELNTKVDSGLRPLVLQADPLIQWIFRVARNLKIAVSGKTLQEVMDEIERRT